MFFSSNWQIHQTTVLEKDAQVLPIKDNSFVASDVHKKSDEHQQSDEESEEDDDDDIVPVEIRPGHIRFEPLKKGLNEDLIYKDL